MEVELLVRGLRRIETLFPVEDPAIRQRLLMELARRNNQPDPKPLHALRHATAPDAPVPSRQVPQAGN